MAAPATATCYGQVIEYIYNRLYLASYTHPPNALTPFPYPSRQPKSPHKRSSKQHGPVPETHSTSKLPPPVYFSVDRALLYNAFHADFGPLHIGHLYRFALYLHEVLGDPEHTTRPVVFWSYADSRSRANAACLLACYIILIQSWPPHLALAPIAQMDPPPMPFRDAGYSLADYTITIQDVVYGVWKAKEEGLIGLADFSLEEYEKYERVDMGDFNWITPSFLAFASPQHQPTEIVATSSSRYKSLPTSISAIERSDLPDPFKMVLSHFTSRNVGLVVRLNSELYSPSYFTALGIAHLDMIFDDGTCPPLKLVRKFINIAHEMITVKHKGIAVHCKAGLGRTGCLIGAYLIYRHGFTANEVIAYMRFMRPGMVVGPQQHWLHLNQGIFREWWFEDSMKDRLSLMLPVTPNKGSIRRRVASNGQTLTPPNGSQKRAALGEIRANGAEPQGTGVNDENLPAPTPGQPRKTSKAYGGNHPTPSVYEDEEEVRPDTEIISMQRHTQGEDESEEEFQIRMLARRPSRSPSSSEKKKRSVSCTTTTTTTTHWDTARGESDIENQAMIPKIPASLKSGRGLGSLSIGKQRATVSRRSTDSKGGIRKTSARVGSVGAVNALARFKQ